MATVDPESALRGDWEILSSELWDKDALDLIETAHVRFDGRNGELMMIAIHGWLDCRYGERDGRPAVEFSWEGHDESDERSGRGWAVVKPDGKVYGRLFLHMGDDSAFAAVRKPTKRRGSGRPRQRR